MKNTLGENLEESLNNPESWIRQAEQQYLVADVISENIGDRGLTEESHLKSVGFLKTTTLLLALCVENSFKGVKAANGAFEVNSKGALTRKTRGGGGSGHSLIQLAEEIGFSLSESEVTLLGRLSEIGIWAGKYHAPIHEKAFAKMCKENPKSLTLPSDLHLVKNILGKATKLAKVPAVLI
jgi:hypothetical protein